MAHAETDRTTGIGPIIDHYGLAHLVMELDESADWLPRARSMMQAAITDVDLIPVFQEQGYSPTLERGQGQGLRIIGEDIAPRKVMYAWLEKAMFDSVQPNVAATKIMSSIDLADPKHRSGLSAELALSLAAHGHIETAATVLNKEDVGIQHKLLAFSYLSEVAAVHGRTVDLSIKIN